MPKDDRLEEQINQFYEHGPDVHDALPMKDYLLKHENNQMAWYLLGKQYLARGQEAKANYCFAQAGAVYEAFESKKSPQIGTGEGLGQEAKTAARTARRRAGWLAGAGAAALLVLGLVVYGERAAAPDPASEAAGQATVSAAPGGHAGAPGDKTPQGGKKGGGTAVAGGQSGKGESGKGEAGEDGKSGQSGKSGQGGQSGQQGAGGARQAGWMAGAAEPDGAGRAILGGLLTAPEQASPAMLFKAPKLGKWVDWVKAGNPIAQVSSPKGQAGSSVDWYDSGWCPCGTALDGKQAAARISAWKPLQESKLVLRSAMIAYKQQTGKWPAAPESLAAAYPANFMSGWNQEQTAWFGELSAAFAAKNASAGASPVWPDTSGPAGGNGKPAGLLAPLAEQPIEIVVDKTRHRLAVVSGGVLLRNYEVALGAKDTPTPEGSFVISEKVRNPNGSATGAFGSRGMTLSDTMYAIHGTDEPTSVGKDASHGCIRMRREDVEELFDLVQIGTKVTIGKGGLPQELRAPEKRFKLKPAQNETNPAKKYEWLN